MQNILKTALKASVPVLASTVMWMATVPAQAEDGHSSNAQLRGAFPFNETLIFGRAPIGERWWTATTVFRPVRSSSN